MGKFNEWLKESITAKLIIIGTLILLLLIPSSMVNSLIYERESLRDNATQEVSAKWGGVQTIGGPVISIPYKAALKNEKNETYYQTQYVHFLPENLRISGVLNPEKRYRGIYVVVLYNSKIDIKGTFAKLDLDKFSFPKEALQLQDAVMTFNVSDMRGINNRIAVKINDETIEASPGTVSSDIFPSGINVPIDLTKANGEINFSTDFDVNGSSEIYFLPFGKETNVSLTSAWGNPSFVGDFLPDTRVVSDTKFSAVWKVLQLNRNFPQQGDGAFISNQSAFGVKLMLPVDEYQKTMRSAKYGVMFIVITFLAFFFIEILNKKRIHPIQYLLVGFAVILFYVLLLSISEHLHFNNSYLLSCVAILLLVSFYVYFVFRNLRLTGIFVAILAMLYGFFYSLLQLQDYALLLGSIGLFVILFTIMYLTRNIDWYEWKRENNQ